MSLREKNADRGGALSSTTVNQCLATLRIMLMEAERLQYIPHDPSRAVGKLKEKPRQRNILTSEEGAQLFDANKVAKVWGNDKRHLCINMVAASTGMRLGEVQALQLQHVHEKHLDIACSWERRYGLKTPENGTTREVTIPKRVSVLLQDLIALSPYKDPEDLVFWHGEQRTLVGDKEIDAALNAARGGSASRMRLDASATSPFTRGGTGSTTGPWA